LRRYIPMMLVICAAALFVAALVLGDMALVWRKAAQLCFECVGIG